MTGFHSIVFFTGFLINPSGTAADYSPDRSRDEASIWTECRYNKQNGDGDKVPTWKSAVHVQKIRLYLKTFAALEMNKCNFFHCPWTIVVLSKESNK